MQVPGWQQAHVTSFSLQQGWNRVETAFLFLWNRSNGAGWKPLSFLPPIPQMLIRTSGLSPEGQEQLAAAWHLKPPSSTLNGIQTQACAQIPWTVHYKGYKHSMAKNMLQSSTQWWRLWWRRLWQINVFSRTSCITFTRGRKKTIKYCFIILSLLTALVLFAEDCFS